MEQGQSMWLDELPGGLTPRAALRGDLSVDVVVIGAGFTGLWTAYYLKTLDPSLSVLVVEREFVGFGASGRNGGWAVGELAAGIEKYARISSLEESLRLTRAVFDSVDEIGRVAADRGIDCGYAKGGTIRLARNKAQLLRQIAEVPTTTVLDSVMPTSACSTPMTPARCATPQRFSAGSGSPTRLPSIPLD